MKIKKLLSMFIIVCAMILLVGCGGSSESPGIKPGGDNNNPGPKPEEHVHQFSEWQIQFEGDCYNRSREIRTCNCGEMEEKEGNFKHNYENHEPLEPTCTSTGHNGFQQCTICGDVIGFTSIDATGHTMGDWYVFREASCDFDGEEVRECENCDYYETLPISATGHDYVDVVTPPTATTKGYTTRTCNNCKDVVVENEIPAILYFEEYKDGELAVGVSLLNNQAFTSITIPHEYNGKIVTKINASGFRDLPNLKEVIIEYDSSNPKEFTIGQYAFENCTSLEYVTILQDCIIENYAFANCSKFNVSDLAKVKSIGSDAFRNCSSLLEFDGIDSATRRVTSIGSSAFVGCTSLKTLYLPNDALTERTLGYYFGAYEYTYHTSYIPTSLTKLIINDTREICDYAFYNCSSLEEIVLNPYYGTLIGEHVFDGCTSLPQNEYQNGKYIKFTNSPDGWILIDVLDKTVTEFNISNSCYIIAENAFAGCENLAKVERFISQYEQITISDYAFSGCSNLNSINISNAVLIGKEAFKDCSSLFTVTLGYPVEIKENAFLNCYNLVSVKAHPDLNVQLGQTSNGCVALYAKEIIKGTQEPNIQNKNGFITFTDSSNTCYLLGYTGTETKLTIPEEIDVINKFAITSSITELIIPNSVTKIEEDALRYAKSLEKLIIPFVGVTPATSTDETKTSFFGSIFGRTHANYAEFDIPSSLQYVEVTGNNIIPDQAFKCEWNKTNIKEVVISGTPEKMGFKVFNYCYGLTNITLPYLGETVEANGELSYSFYEVPNTLKELVILSGTTLKQYAIDQVNIESIVLPEGMTTLSEGAINWCQNLKSITIPSTIEKFYRIFLRSCDNVETIYYRGTLDNYLNYSFIDAYQCPTYYGSQLFLLDDNGEWYELKEVVTPSSITQIGENIFYNLTLDKVTITSNVETIKEMAFSNCSVTTIIIPVSVKVIEASAFKYVNSLTNVYYEGTEEQWKQISISYDNGKLTEAQITFNYAQN